MIYFIIADNLSSSFSSSNSHHTESCDNLFLDTQGLSPYTPSLKKRVLNKTKSIN